MRVSRLASRIISAAAVPLLVLVLSGVASADTTSTYSGTLQPGVSACTGSITGTTAPHIKGVASGTLTWSIWANSTNDLSTAFRIFKQAGTSTVDARVGSNSSFFWACAFNPFSAPSSVFVSNLTIET